LISALHIPGLDTTKIISGIFPQTQVAGSDPGTTLDDELSSLWDSITSGVEAIIQEWQLGNIPVSSIGLFQPELLSNPHYEQDVSGEGGSEWVWDGTVDHDGDGTGSVKVIANGTVHQLFSDPPLPVSPNQVLALSHWLMWSGLTQTGGQCFRFGLVSYKGTTVVATQDLQIISAAAASSTWTKLAGNYTVPASGVDNLRLQLTVTAAVTAGSIWWDTASAKKTQLLFQDWTSGLVGDLNNLLTQVGARALLTDFNSLMSNLGLGTGTLTAITQRFQKMGATGLFDSAALTNMTGFPGIDASKILSGV